MGNKRHAEDRMIVGELEVFSSCFVNLIKDLPGD